MDASSRDIDVSEQQSSFGIKKIVDCKIGEGGRQMYKVKWEPTWEPAENLVSCQHLIDEFWSFVNKAKTNEEVAQQHRKKMRLDQSTNNVINLDGDFDQHRMTEDNKAEVQRLIARANATSVGNPQILMSPSNMLMSPQRNQQNNLMGMARTPTHANNQSFPNSPQTPQNMMRQASPGMPISSPGQKSLNFGSPQQQQPNFGGQQNFNSPGQKGKFGGFGNKNPAAAAATPPKVEPDDSNIKSESRQSGADAKASNISSLKYLENFTNPYVKIIIVCKICNKEQSLKFAGNWRQHYMTHSDQKPHKCQFCSKTFIRADQMRKHVQNKHGSSPAVSKQELMAVPKQEYLSAGVKREGFPF